ncbi:MAG: phosphotransferase [Promethearchaeota archaeon]
MSVDENYPEFEVLETLKSDPLVQRGTLHGIDRQLVAKRWENAEKEWSRMCQARSILSCAVPAVVHHHGPWIFREFIHGDRVELADETQRNAVIAYLTNLHAVDVGRARARVGVLADIPALFRSIDSFLGQSLVDRRIDLCSRFQKEIGRCSLEPARRSQCENLFRWFFEVDLSSTPEDVVLGHGDFQPSNLLYSGGRIIPIDWIEFGVAPRGYDLACLAYTAINLAPVLLARYREVHSLSQDAWRTGVDLLSVMKIDNRLRQNGDQADSITALLDRCDSLRSIQ